MKNRLYLLVCGLLLVAALGGLLWWSPWEARQIPEPVYDARPLSYWLTNHTNVLVSRGFFLSAQSLRSTNNFYKSHPYVWRTTFKYPTRVLNDSNAVPFLIRNLKRDSWIGAAVYREQLWPKLPAAIKRWKPPPSGNPRARMTAADYLAQMGQMARQAIPALVTTTEEDDVPLVRAYAARALGSIGESGSTVTTALTAALKDKDDFVRSTATNALVRLSPEAATKAGISRADLVRWLISVNDSEVRRVAAEALGRLGAAGNSAVAAALTDALKDEDSSVRRAATNALRTIDREAAAKAGIKGPSP
jgi:hypothetical protein